jgi:hypothetical protein
MSRHFVKQESGPIIFYASRALHGRGRRILDSRRPVALVAVITVLLSPVLAGAASFCERLPLDPEFPAGLVGSYDLVGKVPGTGRPYAGTLVIATERKTYRLIRTTDGTDVRGDAWIESCGPDKITVLAGSYDTTPKLEIRCSLGGDGDNYFRVSCRTREAGGDWQGLEAWFQRHDAERSAPDDRRGHR